MNNQPTVLKLDRTKLKTPKSYAALKSVTVQAVYQWMREPGRLRIETIDGVDFIHI